MPASPSAPDLFEYASVAAPMQAWQTGWNVATMLAEAQMVVALRMMGQVGLWSNAPGEMDRMVSEKPAAFVKAATAATQAARRGGRPDQVLAAAVAPLGRKTRSNMHRLTRQGPGVPK